MEYGDGIGTTGGGGSEQGPGKNHRRGNWIHERSPSQAATDPTTGLTENNHSLTFVFLIEFPPTVRAGILLMSS
jgi:hypothetical protein